MSQVGVKNPRIAAFLGISKQSVRNIIRLWVDTGNIHVIGDAALGHPCCWSMMHSGGIDPLY